MSARCNPRYVRGLHLAARIASLGVLALGAVMLTGWLIGHPALRDLPSAWAMHPLTALTFLLLGGASWLQQGEPVSERSMCWGRAMALLAVVLASCELTGHLSGASVENWLHRAPLGRFLPEGLMAPNTALAMVFMGVSLLLLPSTFPRLCRLAQTMAIAAMVVAFLPAVGYLFQIATFTRLRAGYNPMAATSALGFLFAGAAVLASHPERTFMALLCSDRLGGRMLRRLLPALVLAPILLGLLGIWAQRAWGFDAPFGIGLMVTGLVVFTTSLLWWHSSIFERLEAALSDSETKLRTLIDASPDVIMIRDREGRYLLANPAFGRMVGLPLSGILGRTDDAIFEPATARRIQEHDRRVIASESPLSDEIAIRTPAREDRIYDSSKYPYYAPDGTLSGVMAISRDITERKRLEAQLRGQYEKLKELDKLKGDFVNAVSHDLRSPLTSILGYAEFLEDEIGGALTLQQQEFVSQIEKSTKRLEGMVTDLLDFARLDAGTFRLHCEEADLVGRIRDLVDSLRPQAEEHRLTLQTELPGEPLMRVLDPQRIDRVLANLIGNALKFTPEGGRILVKLAEDGEGLLCEVTDTGIGIAPEDLPKLFQRFTQLEAGARMKAGTGLGLSISKAQVEAHGGWIGVRSAPGKGSTFWFRLPYGVPPQCRRESRAS
ncbi:Alkaline phosphatase synthesis sensor protein PhoR [compost metagenome]